MYVSVLFTTENDEREEAPDDDERAEGWALIKLLNVGICGQKYFNSDLNFRYIKVCIYSTNTVMHLMIFLLENEAKQKNVNIFSCLFLSMYFSDSALLEEECTLHTNLILSRTFLNLSPWQDSISQPIAPISSVAGRDDSNVHTYICIETTPTGCFQLLCTYGHIYVLHKRPTQLPESV
jgi:hypothetical protein